MTAHPPVLAPELPNPGIPGDSVGVSARIIPAWVSASAKFIAVRIIDSAVLHESEPHFEK